jgi:hypothetical protein
MKPYFVVLFLLLWLPISTFADEPGPSDYGYSDEQSDTGRVSSSSYRKPEGQYTWWESTSFWVANRAIDLIDIFRIDVGVGAAAGGVLRLTREGQIGYRHVGPFSARIGDFGRRASPILVERDSEIGVGKSFKGSRDRKVCRAEFGLGLDLGIGAYAGLCIEEVGDFFAGIFNSDPSGDDVP